MNGFLWLGVACATFLVIAVVFDGLDDAFDALDLGPSWLSLPVLAAFLGAFGFGTGAVYGELGTVALLPGIAVGAGFAWLAARFTAAALHMPTGSIDTEEAMLGSLGRIVTVPEPGRFGEVLLARPTGPVKVACTAAERIPAGTEVVVVDVVSSTLVRVDPFDLPTLGPA
jgi:hypothetical protein